MHNDSHSLGGRNSIHAQIGHRQLRVRRQVLDDLDQGVQLPRPALRPVLHVLGLAELGVRPETVPKRDPPRVVVEMLRSG